jgi:hypothetical protein
MACNTLQNILKSCDGNAGGIVEFYINNSDAVESFGLTSSGEIDSIIIGSMSADFVKFEFNPNTSNYTENEVINLQNGTTYYEPVITLQLARRENLKRQKLLLISKGQPKLTIIVKDSNGLFWGFGFGDDKMYLTNNEGGSGQAKGDLNGYTLTFSVGDGGGSSEPAYEIDPTIIPGIVQA